jgi:hypothetical protein
MYGWAGLFPFLFLTVKYSRGGPYCRDLLEKRHCTKGRLYPSQSTKRKRTADASSRIAAKLG